jgi:hypothetical protein
MLAILLLVFLGLFRKQSQRVQGQDIALPLMARSPYLSCWLVQTNSTSLNITDYYLVQPLELITGPSNFSYVRPFRTLRV